jgi:hypothetical protein
MQQPPLIALLTDFGLDDPFVGVMKGVIATICRPARVIDLCHAVSAQNVREAAFHLDRALPFFPEGTIFVCVVDPGVGTARRPIAVEAGPFRFVAPDNGLLTPVFERYPDLRCHLISNTACHLPSPSATFHGRDIFSPAAAHLAGGLPIDQLGPAIEPSTCIRIPLFINHPIEEIDGWQGEIITIDRFGNLVTSFDASMVDEPAIWHIRTGPIDNLPILTTYGDAEEGKLLAYIGSSGMIEVAVRNGNAQEALGVGRNMPVFLLRNHPVQGSQDRYRIQHS